MTEPNVAFPSLGSRIARSQDRWLPQTGLRTRTRKEFLRHPWPRPRRGGLALAGYAFAGAAAAAALLLWYTQRPLHLETTGLSTMGQPADMFASAAPGTMAFSDGSRVIVDPLAQVRLEQVTARGARIRLQQGALHADIAHRARTAWFFHAGPFAVDVIGTAFDLQWQQRELTLAVREGAVRVSGCALPDLKVAAGQSATLSCPETGAPLVVGRQDAPALSASAPCAPSAPSAPVPAVANPVSPAITPPTPASGPALAPSAATVDLPDAAPDWRALVAKGNLRDAYAAAEAAGFDAECGMATARELLDLSDCALLAGRADRAGSALLTLRRRFPGSAAATSAAYKLGKIAFDQRGALGDARTWFDVYLREAPSGGLAREALGRLVEIEYHTGNTPAARQRAEQYLKQYPNGPHAELARRVLGQ